MSDLVEKLRALHVFPQSVADTHPDIIGPRSIRGLYEVGNTSHEAANEIERLREALEKYQAAVSWIETPFIDEDTPEKELRSRIKFCVKDAERARNYLQEQET